MSLTGTIRRKKRDLTTIRDWSGKPLDKKKKNKK